MIAGIGVDTVEVDRIAKAINRLGRRFIERVFTEDEIAYCESRPSPPQHYAARFAAKEAALKVLGTGWSAGVRWKDVEVVSDSSRNPSLRLHGMAGKIARGRSISTIHISLSHTSSIATAVAAAEGTHDFGGDL